MTAPTRVVIAPDKFKGSLTAAEVAAAVGAGVRRARPTADVVPVPVADGGDGTLDAAVSAGFTRVPVTSVGPTGEPVTTSYAVNGDLAIVELATVVGLGRLPGGRLDPTATSTYGVGLVMLEAIAGGARELVLAVGGSASTDGGAGMVQALGGRVTNARGDDLPRGGGALVEAAGLEVATLVAAMGDTSVVVASDVENPLLGPTGAAAVFGPQKGAGPAEIEELEQGLERWSRLVADVTGRDRSTYPGAGAAGGIGFAAVSLLGAEVRPGIELILDLVGFRDAVAGADLVVTGEGSLDEQSLAGKAPVGVSRAAATAGVPVVAVAGRCLLNAEQLRSAGISAAYPLSDLEPDPARSMAAAAPLLTRTGERLAREWLP